MKFNIEKIVERRYRMFPLSIAAFLSFPEYMKKYIPDYKEGNVCIFVNRNGGWYYRYPHSVRDYQVKQYHENGSDYLWKMAKTCTDLGEKVLDSFNAVNLGDIDGMTNEELLNFLQKPVRFGKEFAVFYTIPWILESFFEDQLDKILEKRVNTDAIIKVREALAMPIKHNDSQKEIISLLNIALAVKNNEELLDFFNNASDDEILNKIKESHGNIFVMLGEHLNKFGHIQMLGLFGSPLKEIDLVVRVKQIIKEKPEEKLKELSGAGAEIEKEMFAIAKKYNFSEDELNLIKVMKEYIFLRTHRTDVFCLFFSKFIPFLKVVAKRLEIEYDDVLNMTHEEVLESLKGGELIKTVNLEDRRQGETAYRREGDKQTVYETKSEVDKLIKEYEIEEEKLDDIKEFKGNIGFSGVVRGTVKVVFTPDDLDKVKRGDVLVAIMTFPAYVVAMERASSFVTDEGGILCHAAIVAREMKKPCIIATKIATKVLKDGDEVEVDGENGIVRKIK